jgi:carbonic anhydrase
VSCATLDRRDASSAWGFGRTPGAGREIGPTTLLALQDRETETCRESNRQIGGCYTVTADRPRRDPRHRAARMVCDRRSKQSHLSLGADITATDALLRNNEAYAANFHHAELPALPSMKLAVVACMDARLDPARVLGLSEGDAHVIRNAGGVITDDAIRSLSISQHHLATEEIVLLHHTQCGMQTFSDEDFAAARERSRGLRPDWSARTFTDLEDDLRESIRRIRDSPFIPRKDSIRAFIYEVESGRIREVS